MPTTPDQRPATGLQILHQVESVYAPRRTASLGTVQRNQDRGTVEASRYARSHDANDTRMPAVKRQDKTEMLVYVQKESLLPLHQYHRSLLHDPDN